MNDYLECTIHNFKTNLSRYIKMLEQGKYRAMVVKRGRKPVGLFVPFDKKAAQAARAEAEAQMPTGPRDGGPVGWA